jgi:Flp pilus assembly protein TadG
MLQSRHFHSEDGSAALEFITAGLLLLVPLVYLVIAVAAVQGGALAVEGASRQAARVFVQAPTTVIAQSRARTAVDFALADFGVSGGSASVRVSCSPHPAECLTRRGFVTVTVTERIALPLAPPALSVKTPLTVPLTATSTEQVSRFWGAG